MKSFIEENVGKAKDIPLLCKPVLLQSGIRVLNLTYYPMYFVEHNIFTGETSNIEVPPCGFVPQIQLESEPIPLGDTKAMITKAIYVPNIDSQHILDVIQYEDHPGVILLGTEVVSRAYAGRVFQPMRTIVSSENVSEHQYKPYDFISY